MKLGRTKLLVISAVLGVGCAAHPFLRADPPVDAGGVRVGLVDQKCDRMIDPNWSYADILGLEVHVEVTNSTTDPMTFEPAKVRLLADGEARKPHKSDDSALIPAGASKIFKVTFFERDDNLACNVPMALGVAQAATTGSTPLPLRPISFLVSRDDI
jgi:hypothetical protein